MSFILKKTLFIIVLSIVFGCTLKKETLISYTNSQIEYSGRIDSSKIKAAEIYWSGTSIKFNFEGASISALIKDEKGDNYYNIIIDNEAPFILRPGTNKQYYQLA
jgi:hypothetical protein